MSNSLIQYLNLAILALAVILIVLGVFVVVIRGLFDSAGVDRLYELGRQRYRQLQFQGVMQGVVLLVMGIALLILWSSFKNAPGRLSAESPPLITMTPQTTALATAVISSTRNSMPTPVVATISSNAATTTPATIPPSLEPTKTPLPTDTPVPTETPLPTATPLPTQARVNHSEQLNLRDVPGGEVIDTLENGELLTLLQGYQAHGGYNWREVQTSEGVIGWVAEPFIEYIYK